MFLLLFIHIPLLDPGLLKTFRAVDSCNTPAENNLKHTTEIGVATQKQLEIVTKSPRIRGTRFLSLYYYYWQCQQLQ